MLNETRQNEKWQNTEYFKLENYSFNTGNICSKIGQIDTEIYWIFQDLNEYFIILRAKFSKSWTIEWPLNSVFTNKYDTDREIMNTYENLQIVWTQFFTDKLIFIYIRYNLNIYWFICIRIRLVL